MSYVCWLILIRCLSTDECEPDMAVRSEGEVETGEESSAVDVAADRETVPGCLPSVNQ